MSKLPAVTVVIPNYNGERWLHSCLSSIFKNAYSGGIHVLVVDNASGDSSKEVVEKFSQATFLPVGFNSGFAHACNVGLAAAKTEYVVLLNNDTEVKSSWLSSLVARAESDEKIAAVNGCSYLFSSRTESVPRVQNAGNIIFRSGYGRDRGAMVEGGNQEYEPDTDFFHEAREPSAFCGVNVLLRRSVFLKVGGFRKEYFMYYEDAELSLRLRRLGYKIYYEPGAAIWHHHAASSKENSSFFTFYVERNRLLFLLEHFPWSVFIREVFLYKIQILVSSLRWLKSVIKMKNKDNAFWGARTLLRVEVYLHACLLAPRSLLHRWQLTGKEKKTVREVYSTLY